ncbi:uncharacterized protein [Mytilus edulis]|uniref:uncharacterized protein n=1 Tax=Mytilus edulis TaxID=6550 RepID=UPI0039EFA666
MFARLTDATIYQFEQESSQSDDELSNFDEGVSEPVEEPQPRLEPEQALEPEKALEPELALDPEPPLKKPRFKEMPSREHIDIMAQARVEETTKQQTDWGVRLFRGWLTENQYSDKFEELESSILNERLCFFYPSLQTKKGTDYSKSPLVGIRAAISRHLTSPPYNRNVNLMKDNAFMTSNHALTGMIKTLKRAGKDVTVHKKPVAEGDIQRLYSSGVFNTDSPATLQNKVFWDLMLNFGRQGQEGLNSLTKSSFGKFKDDRDHTYYKMTYNEANKTHHGVDSHENHQEVRMYEKSGDENCPVSSFDFYVSKLSPKCNALFQQPLLYPKPNCWYANQAMGKNKLSQMMPRISNEAGLSYRYTNHCIKATVGTGLKRAGVDDLTNMSVTGHRNIKSLESYVAGPSDAQRRALSSTLQGVATASNSNESVSKGPSCQVSNHVSTISRNPLSDMSIFTNATITKGTFTINLVSKDLPDSPCNMPSTSTAIDKFN